MAHKPVVLRLFVKGAAEERALQLTDKRHGYEAVFKPGIGRYTSDSALPHLLSLRLGPHRTALTSAVSIFRLHATSRVHVALVSARLCRRDVYVWAYSGQAVCNSCT